MPSFAKSLLIACFGTAVAVAPLAGAAAQEISPSQLAAAELVVKSAPQIGNFDILLPQAATMMKNDLIGKRPDLYKEITQVVNDDAAKLVPRRADLDKDIARVWAKNFTEDELKAINDFFTSDVGQKYKELAPVVGPDVIQASKNWRDRVRGELLDMVTADLKKMGHEL
jgi:uncharacterized protein